MPITIPRDLDKAGAVPQLPPEVAAKAWEVILRAWVDQNRDQFAAMVRGGEICFSAEKFWRIWAGSGEAGGKHKPPAAVRLRLCPPAPLRGLPAPEGISPMPTA